MPETMPETMPEIKLPKVIRLPKDMVQSVILSSVTSLIEAGVTEIIVDLF
jgi:hypothetical protein